MLVERERPIPVLESEKPLLEKSMGIALASVILSHLTINSLPTLLRNPSELLSNLPSYPKLQTLNKFKGPEDEAKIFTELFASALTKSWNTQNTKNVSEKESRLALYCAELRNKGYNLKRVMQEVCKHFNLSLTEALEIAKKEYFTINDLARELEINTGSAKNRVLEALKKDRTINAEHFGGKERRRTFIPQSQRNNLKSIVESLIQTAIVTLPDNSAVTIKGRLKKQILDLLLQAFNQPHGLALAKIIDLYPKGDRDARVKANHVIQDFRKKLQAFGWIIENRYISKGRGRKPISEYFLKQVDNATSSPAHGPLPNP